jgi:hypothetical protein
MYVNPPIGIWIPYVSALNRRTAATIAALRKQDNPSPFLSFDCDPDVVSGSPEPDGYVARHQHQDRPHSP